MIANFPRIIEYIIGDSGTDAQLLAAKLTFYTALITTLTASIITIIKQLQTKNTVERLQEQMIAVDKKVDANHSTNTTSLQAIEDKQLTIESKLDQHMQEKPNE